MLNVILAMFILGFILGLILFLANQIFKVVEDKRVDEVTKLLPGYNCGTCGYPGCKGMAEALVNKETDTITCRPSKPEKRQAIIDYLANTVGPDGKTIKIKSI